MRVVWVARAVALSLVLAGCGAGAAASPASPTPQPASSDGGMGPIASVEPSPTTAMPIASPTLPRSSAVPPKPTAAPVPAMPTGIRSHEDIEAICDPDDPGALCGVGNSTFTVSWSSPRTKGVEIRVYGVKRCYATDARGTMIDGWCLREHTALPTYARVLLARTLASKGEATFQLAQDRRWYATLDGTRIYAVVLAAYAADGSHSTFAIADRAESCMAANVACNGVDTGPETYLPGSWMATIVAGVRVRSRPGLGADSHRYTPLLPKGTEFGIVRGPALADGYRWYLVDLTPGTLDAGVTRGWVADGSRDGEPWIANIGIDDG